MKTAVVILNWNTEGFLKEFLPGLLHSVQNVDGAEVIVADNASTDGSMTVMKEYFPSVRTIELEKNFGFTGGYNKAFDQIDSEYFLLINSDIEVTEGWLEPLVQWMDTHPECGACAPKLHSWQEREKFEYAGAAGGYIDRFGYPFCRGRVMKRLETDCGQYDSPADVFWATGACLMVRSSLYRKLGGLDERFFAHMEEIDLCWRLRARGRSIVCIPDSRVYHVGGATLSKENPRKTFLNFRNNLLLLYKNLPEADLRPVMRLRRLLDYVAALKFLLSGETGNARAVIRARREFKRIRNNYTAARQENLRKATGDTIPEIMQKSLLWQYYAKGKKTFTQLHQP